MGTSVNQGSPKTPGWNTVAKCFTDSRIPVEQVGIEVWRAALNQDPTVAQQLTSPIVASCLEIAATYPSRTEALAAVQALNQRKDNSVLAEFAKRALISNSISPTKDSPPVSLLRQVTDYYVSRDLPGYIGEGFRCKTVSELKDFKASITKAVVTKVSQLERNLEGSNMNWPDKISSILNGLKRR